MAGLLRRSFTISSIPLQACARRLSPVFFGINRAGLSFKDKAWTHTRSRSSTAPGQFLNSQFQQIRLVDKVSLTPDTYRFRFQFSEKPCKLGLPAGQHINIYCPNRQGVKPGEWNHKPDTTTGKEEIVRYYTPVHEEEDTKGYVDIVVKIYKPVEPEFPDGGKMSAYFDGLKLGDQIKIKGPVGSTIYHGNGHFTNKGSPLTPRKYVGLIAGGTGITPILQVLRKSFNDPNDTTEFWLISANKTPDDIIERGYLEELKEAYPDRFHLWFVVDKIPEDCITDTQESWAYSIGLVNEEMLKNYLPPPGPDSVCAVCGPPKMFADAVFPAMTKLGWELKDIVKF